MFSFVYSALLWDQLKIPHPGDSSQLPSARVAMLHSLLVSLNARLFFPALYLVLHDPLFIYLLQARNQYRKSLQYVLADN